MAYTDRFYIQKSNGSYPVKETISDFDIYLKDIPFKPSSEVKELYSNDWFDEDGDDEYIPSELKLAAHTIDVEFAYKGDKNTAYTKIKPFLDYLTGRDGTGSEFKFVCTYNGYGRQKVRFKGMSDDAELVRQDNFDILIFKVTFKVNDPVHNVVAVNDEKGNIIQLQ